MSLKVVVQINLDDDTCRKMAGVAAVEGIHDEPVVQVLALLKERLLKVYGNNVKLISATEERKLNLDQLLG